VKTRLLAWFWLLALSQAALAQQVRPVDSDSVDAGLKAVRGGSPRRGTHVIAETPYPSRINRLTEENLPAIWRRGRDYSALRASPLRGRLRAFIPASLLGVDRSKATKIYWPCGGEGGIVRGCAAHPSASLRDRRRCAPASPSLLNRPTSLPIYA